MKIIEAKNLQIGYGKNVVQRGLNFSVSGADFICVVGSNGSGKTTLILTILGLIPKISGELVVGLPQTEIGYMPQTSKLMDDFPATVYEVVESGVLTNGRGRAEVEKALSRFDLTRHARAKYSELSGGLKQRVLLARAVVATGGLLILDEPYNNLDAASREKLYGELRALNKEGVAIIMITHDLDHSSLLGDKTLALMGDGCFYGPTKKYIEKVHREGWNA